MYKLTENSPGVTRTTDGAHIPNDQDNADWNAYQAWLLAGNTPEPVPAEPIATQFELDQRRYQRRATVQAELMSWMAADNMSRVRSGAWTVPQLTGLLDDPAVKATQTYMATLSYELAAQSIAAATTPLLTAEIKTAWIAKLQAHFYLVP